MNYLKILNIFKKPPEMDSAGVTIKKFNKIIEIKK